MIDLCKIFGVEEGEEFKFSKHSLTHRINNNGLEVLYEGEWGYTAIAFNVVITSEIEKLQKKKEFTDDELCILRNIDKKFKWICRELRTDNILLFEEKPLKHDSKAWVCDEGTVTFFRAFDHLFQSIQWEDKEPVFIDDYVERGVK